MIGVFSCHNAWPFVKLQITVGAAWLVSHAAPGDVLHIRLIKQTNYLAYILIIGIK
jgi:hypothetical protein